MIQLTHYRRTSRLIGHDAKEGGVGEFQVGLDPWDSVTSGEDTTTNNTIWWTLHRSGGSTQNRNVHWSTLPDLHPTDNGKRPFLPRTAPKLTIPSTARDPILIVVSASMCFICGQRARFHWSDYRAEQTPVFATRGKRNIHARSELKSLRSTGPYECRPVLPLSNSATSPPTGRDSQPTTLGESIVFV